MASNIIDLIKDQLSDSFGEAAAGATGLGAEQTRKTIGAAIPAVLAGILGAGGDTNGRECACLCVADSRSKHIDQFAIDDGGW